MKWNGAVESEASWEKTSNLWHFEKEVKAVEDTLLTRTSASSGEGALLRALLLVDDIMRNKGAGAALG